MRMLKFVLVNIVVAFCVSVAANTFGPADWVSPQRSIAVDVVKKIVSIDSDRDRFVKFLIGGNEVDSYIEYYFIVRNDGKVGFEKGDFVRPLSFAFSSNVKFYGVYGVGDNTDDAEILIKDGVMSIGPFVFNAGECFEFVVRTNLESEFYGIGGKVRGVKDVSWEVVNADDPLNFKKRIDKYIDIYCMISIFVLMVILVFMCKDDVLYYLATGILSGPMIFTTSIVIDHYGLGFYVHAVSYVFFLLLSLCIAFRWQVYSFIKSVVSK